MSKVEKYCNINLNKIDFFKNISNDAYSKYIKDNSFIVFTSHNDIIYLIYTDLYESIISFNLISQKKICEIKNAHNKYITNFRYYFDEVNKRDLIISISLDGNDLKLWNVYNFSCLLFIKKINKYGTILSASFLNDNNQIYIITSNNYLDESEPIKVFNLKGIKIKEINNSNISTNFIDTFYDNELKSKFIITGNKGKIISYNYDKNKIYHTYSDNDKSYHESLIINDKKQLIDSCDDGNIRIWNFHSGYLLNKIKFNAGINGICLLNNEYLFMGCDDQTIKIIQLSEGKIIKYLIGHEDIVISVKIFIHPKYGVCLLSQGFHKDGINLWIIKN